jgi:hypothetical protein
MNSERQEAIFRITARYVAEMQAGQQPEISDYIARYPQYTEAIADFVAYYHGIEVGGPDTTVSSPLSHISQIALARALQQVPSEPPSVKAITTLLATEQRHFTLSALARKLDLSVDIVALLEQRAIDPSTLPFELYRRIANVLQQPIRSVQVYLSWSPHESQSDNKVRRPMKVAEQHAPYHVPGDQYAEEQGFRQIVAESLWLSPEQRDTWEAILTLEDL